jgi:hypothetical protein
MPTIYSKNENEKSTGKYIYQLLQKKEALRIKENTGDWET